MFCHDSTDNLTSSLCYQQQLDIAVRRNDLSDRTFNRGRPNQRFLLQWLPLKSCVCFSKLQLLHPKHLSWFWYAFQNRLSANPKWQGRDTVKVLACWLCQHRMPCCQGWRRNKRRRRAASPSHCRCRSCLQFCLHQKSMLAHHPVSAREGAQPNRKEKFHKLAWCWWILTHVSTTYRSEDLRPGWQNTEDRLWRSSFSTRLFAQECHTM